MQIRPAAETAAVREETGWQVLEREGLRTPGQLWRMSRRFSAACHEADVSVTRSLLGLARYRVRGHWIWAHPGTRIRGIENLETRGLLKIGIDMADISHPDDKTWLRIDGRMEVGKRCKIGRGARVHVGRRAHLRFAEGVWLNGNVMIHLKHGMDVGPDCLLSWNSQYIDDDFHRIVHPDDPDRRTGGPIKLGRRVLVGNRATIGGGVELADGTIVAGGSLVTKSVLEPNCLVAGIPAKVVKTGVDWH